MKGLHAQLLSEEDLNSPDTAEERKEQKGNNAEMSNSAHSLGKNRPSKLFVRM